MQRSQGVFQTFLGRQPALEADVIEGMGLLHLLLGNRDGSHSGKCARRSGKELGENEVFYVGRLSSGRPGSAKQLYKNEGSWNSRSTWKCGTRTVLGIVGQPLETKTSSTLRVVFRIL